MQIDHSLYPDAMLFAYTYGGQTGDAVIKITDENGDSVSDIYLHAKLQGGSSIAIPKSCAYIRSSEGRTKNYTITVTTQNGNAACAMNLGTEETFAEDFGGRNNVASLAKNLPYQTYIALSKGRVALLEGEGEWFRYTADGHTCITALMSDYDGLAFEVHDADTDEVVAVADENDRAIQRNSNTMYTGYVQKALELEPGHEYLIKVYATSQIPDKDFDRTYNISVGLPYLSMETAKITSDSSYSLTANKEKTFRFTVNQAKSDRLAKEGQISFATTSTVNNFYITSCKITAPDGQVFRGTNGCYTYKGDPDVINYLTSPSNIPLNGTWTVTVKSSKSLSGLRFKIIANYYHIYGNYGN